MIHFYTGNGKGKTTLAAGAALRMIGSGGRVLFVQFFKPWKISGEIRALKKNSLFDYINISRPTDALIRKLLARIEKKDYRMVVLDEFLLCGKWKILPLKDIIASFDRKREWILTGRTPVSSFFKAADYITEMRERKHPFRQGVKARRGVEY